jgi:hypothetical protein
VFAREETVTFAYHAETVTLRARCPACDTVAIVPPAPGNRWADERTSACSHYQGRVFDAHALSAASFVVDIEPDPEESDDGLSGACPCHDASVCPDDAREAYREA